MLISYAAYAFHLDLDSSAIHMSCNLKHKLAKNSFNEIFMYIAYYTGRKSTYSRVKHYNLFFMFKVIKVYVYEQF